MHEVNVLLFIRSIASSLQRTVAKIFLEEVLTNYLSIRNSGLLHIRLRVYQVNVIGKIDLFQFLTLINRDDE